MDFNIKIYHKFIISFSILFIEIFKYSLDKSIPRNFLLYFLAISHVLSAIFCFITIIGIPFGIQHLKLALISLFPIGQTIVDKELANEVRMRNAKDIVDGLRA